MKPILDKFTFLNRNPKFRRFLQDNGVQLNHIYVILMEEVIYTPKYSVGAFNAQRKTGEIIYIVKGPMFEMKIHCEKDILRIISSDSYY